MKRVLCSTALIGLAVASILLVAPSAGATDPMTLTGEGGSFAAPLMNQLINDASVAIAPESAGYIDLDVDQGREDFADLGDDFAVSEYPLTSAEQSTAAASGRTYAYVPFAAIPVVIGANVIVNNNQGASTSLASNWLQDLQLTPQQLLFLFADAGYSNGYSWDDNPLLADASAANAAACAADPTSSSCTSLTVADTTQSSTLTPLPVVPKEPSATMTALESLFENDQTTASSWNTYAQYWLNKSGTTANDELWPNDGEGTGDDYNVLSAMFPTDPTTNGQLFPTLGSYFTTNGSVAALPSDWITSYVPVAKLQNASGHFVAPSPASAQVALTDASVDPKTNLVTFPTADMNVAAYPMTQMSYLIVATSGMSQAKDTAMGQLIQFILSSSGAADITAAGAAPITKSADPTLYSADEAVASQLLALGSATPTTTTVVSGTTSTTTPTTTTVATSPGLTPSGFTTIASETLGSGGGMLEGTTGTTKVVIDVPTGDLATPTQVTLAEGPTSSVSAASLPKSDKADIVLSISLSQGGTALAGKLTQPIDVTLDSLSIARSARLLVYNDATKAYGPVSGAPEISSVVARTGVVTFEITSDPQIALVQPPVRAAHASSKTTTGPRTSSTQPTSRSSTAGSGGVLAFTGFSPLPLVLVGVLLMAIGEVERRRSRHQRRGRARR